MKQAIVLSGSVKCVANIRWVTAVEDYEEHCRCIVNREVYRYKCIVR